MKYLKKLLEILLGLLRKLRLSELSDGYRIEMIPMPMDPMCDMIYDFPNRTIWINSAANPDADIIRYKPYNHCDNNRCDNNHCDNNHCDR